MTVGQDELRVLYVDDSVMDRELVRIALSDHPDIHLTEAATREEFLALLPAANYDLILSDFNILGFPGLEVIESVKRSLGDVPVVIVTGTGNEEVAVESMKRGAADYVIKSASHIRKLPATIRAAVEARRLRRERERLQAELDRFFALSSDMLCVLDREMRLRRINPAFEETLGYPLDEVIGRRLYQIVESEDWDPVATSLNRLQVGEGGERFTCRCRHRDGSTRWIEWNICAATGDQDFYATARNVTDQRRTEEQERARILLLERVANLSPRERAVLELVVAGNTNKVIAHALHLSERTVEKHRSHGMKKLKLSSSADLIRIAVAERIW